jgi:hypothetical protein
MILKNQKKVITMKRHLTFLWILLVALSTNICLAQEVTTVADGTATDTRIPIYGYNANTSQHQQVIYPSEMLTDMVGGVISSMTFYMSILPDNLWNCTFTFSLGSSDVASFQSAAFLPTTDMVEVYSGIVQIDATAGLMTINFTQPYTYTGGNLLLDVQGAEDGTIASTARFLGTDSNNGSVYTYVFLGQQRYTRLSFIPKTSFTYTGGSTCMTPTDLVIVEANATTATVSWHPRSTGAQYQVFCDTAGADLSTAVWILTSDTIFTFNNLVPNASHVAYVRSYCDGETSSVASVSFHTDCNDVIDEFPWSEDFEDSWTLSYVFGQQNSSPQCWKIYNGGTTEHSAGSGAFYWKVNTNPSQVHSGQHSAVCYTDYALARHNDWLVSPMFNLTGEQKVSFYVQNHVENTSKVDEISVWISEENAVLHAPVSDTAALPGFTQLFQTEIPIGEFQAYEVSLAGYSGHRYIAFVRRNQPNAGWYLCLDDVTIENIPPCAEPVNLSAASSAFEAQLTWEGGAEHYNLYYKQVSDAEYIVVPNISLNNDSVYTLSGLTPATAYQWYVEAICNDQSLMTSEVSAFNTACILISNVPRMWDFESNNYGGTPTRPLPACWERKGSLTYPYVYDNQYVAYSGHACLHSGDEVANAMVVLPQIDVTVLPINTLQVRFFAKFLRGSGASIDVGLMSNLTDISTFVPVYTIQNLSSDFIEYQVTFAHTSSDASYIVIRMNPHDGDLYLDDLVLEEIPDCGRPTSLRCTNITSNSATISWSSSTSENVVYYQQAGSAAFVATEDSPIMGTSYTFNDLLPNTQYSVYVSSLCMDGTEIASSVLTFTSDCIAMNTIPYTWDFESNNTSGVAAYPMQVCWNRLNAAATSLYVSNVSVMAHNGSHCMYSIYPNDYLLVMPTIDTEVLSLNDLQLGFYAKTNYGRVATLEVGVITDPSDPSTFESIETFSLTINYQLYEVVFSRYMGHANHLAFRLNSTSDYIVIDDVTLAAAPPCPRPSDFRCVSTSANAVALTWEPGSDEEYWDLVYVPHGFDPNTASTVLMLDSNSAYIYDLMSSSIYDFYVRANCGEEDGVSGWLGLYNVIPGSYLMKKQGVDTLYTCGAVIYDDGGPDGNYSSNCDAYLIIYPDEENSFVEISGLLTAESSYWDYLVVYDGAGTGRELYRSMQDGSATIAIPSITSTIGPLTLHFHSDFSMQDRGFVIYTTCVSCVAPNPVVTSVGMDSVALSWTASDVLSYELVCGPVGFNPDVAPAITITGASSYTISNLAPDTTLEVRVRARCDESYYSSWSGAVLVSTLPYQPATLPYSCDFENETENASWIISNGRQTNAWYIGSAVNNTVNGDHSLYISTDSGLTNSYQQDGAISVVWAYRDFQFPDGDEFLLSFDWRCFGEGYGSYLWDYLSVYIGSPIKKIAGDDSEPQGAEFLDALMLKSTWGNAEYLLDGVFANTTQRLYFVWQNDISDGENPPAAIDNIAIRAVNCARPIDLIVSDVTPTTATISITAVDEVIAWQLKYGNDTIVTVMDSTYVLTGLIPASEYEVCARSICANGDTSRWTPVYYFLTGCKPIGSSDIPYSCDFEDNNHGGSEMYPLPTCWYRIGAENYPYVDSYQGNSYSGISSLRSGDDPIDYIVVLPAINTSEISANMLQVSFHAKISSYYDHTCSIEVGMMNSMDDAASFEPVDTITDLMSIYKEFEVYMDTYEGQGVHPAFRINATGSVGDYGFYSPAIVYIDDVVINYIPTCRRPSDLKCINNTPTSVSVTWTPRGQESQWAVVIGDYGFDPEETGFVHVTDVNVFEFNDLLTDSVYDIYVRANCEGAGNSVWYGPLTIVPGAFYMNIAGTDTIHACDVLIYDDGGPYGNYSDNCDAYMVVFPDQPGLFVQINGTMESENHDYDYLEIYDGVGANELLFASQNEESIMFNIPSVISSTGPLTVHFHSDYSINLSGFVLHVSCASCIAPELTLNSFYTDSAVISWRESSVYGYQLVYGLEGFSPNLATPINVIANSYNLTGLIPNTTYEVYVRAICDEEGYSNWSNALSFTTLPFEPARVPYFCDFEDEMNRGKWTFLNGMETNKWYINHFEGENNVMYVSSDGGQTNTYETESISNVWAFRDFTSDSLAELVLSFDWRCYGERMYGTNFDFLRVYFGEAGPIWAGSESVPDGVVEIDLLNMQESWTQSEYSLGNVEAGEVKRLYFLWHNDGSEGSNPPAAIDNIDVKAIHCARPVEFRASNISSNSATMVVTYGYENVIGWQLQYGDNDPVTVIGDTVIVVNNLIPATEYEFFARSICDNGDTSVWTSYSFITECVALGVSDLPYFCDFESNNIGGTSAYPLPACWSRIDEQLPYVDVFSYGAHSGNRYLYSGADANDLFVILPEINVQELPINQLQLGFYAQLSDFEGSIDVGVMTDPTNSMTFVPVGTVGSLTYEYTEYEVSLSQYSGSGSYIAMRLNSVGGLGNYGDYLYSLLYVDDIKLSFIPDCQHPSDLNQSNITSHSADLTWSDVANSYIVYYREVGTSNYIVVEDVMLTDGVYTLSGLSPDTRYEWYVASLCVNGSVEPSHITGTFTTLCETIVDFPYQETFNNGLGCWVSSTIMGDDWQWQIDNEYGDPYGEMIGPAEGSHYAKAYYPGYNNAYRLASPVFDLSSMEDPYIKFYRIQKDWDGDLDYLRIYYKNSLETQPVLLAEYTTLTYPWRLDSLALPNPSANYQLFFDAYLNWGLGVGVDNVMIYDRNAIPPVELPVVVTDVASEITSSSAVLHGAITDFGNQTIMSRGFEWKQTNGGTYSPVQDTGTGSSMTYSLSGLTHSTSYSYRAFVATADTVIYGAVVPFTTLEDMVSCEPPVNLQVSNIYATSAEVSWTAGGEEDSWVVEHKLQGTSEWQEQSLNTTQVTLTNLTPSSTYMVRVKSVCDNEESSYVTTSFVTTVGIRDVNYEQYIQLMPNPADEYIDLHINNNMEVKEALIYNAFGQMVQTVVLTDNYARINLSGMASGMYFVRVRHNQGIVTKKFIKR